MNPESRTMLPKQAFTGFAARYSPPTLDEGFVDITKVDFEVRCRSISSRVKDPGSQAAAITHGSFRVRSRFSEDCDSVSSLRINSQSEHDRVVLQPAYAHKEKQRSSAD